MWAYIVDVLMTHGSRTRVDLCYKIYDFVENTLIFLGEAVQATLHCTHAMERSGNRQFSRKVV